MYVVDVCICIYFGNNILPKFVVNSIESYDYFIVK